MGRKWPFFLSVAIQLPCLVTVVFSRSLHLNFAISFIMGFLHIGIYNGGYVNVCEYVDKPWKNHVCTVLLCFDMLSTILIGVYFHYISRYWLWYALIGLVFNLISFVGIFLIPESPEYLYCFYMFPECRAVIEKIATWNRVKEPSFGKFDVEVDIQQIRFSKQIAERQDNYVYSIVKGEEHRTAIKI